MEEERSRLIREDSLNPPPEEDLAGEGAGTGIDTMGGGGASDRVNAGWEMFSRLALRGKKREVTNRMFWHVRFPQK